jgi:hypothetical protein
MLFERDLFEKPFRTFSDQCFGFVSAFPKIPAIELASRRLRRRA